MKVSICFRYFHILLVLLIEFNLEAVSTTYENSTTIGETLTHQLQSVKARVSERIQTIVFHGCFSVWKGQRSRLEPPGRSSQFDELNNVASCTEKCRLKDPNQPQMAFLRGKQCLCSPQSNFASERTSSDDCNHACPGGISSLSGIQQDITNACGGNFGYSVYCLDNCDSLPPKQKQTTIEKDDAAVKKLHTSFATISLAPVYTCAKCHRNQRPVNLCTEPVSISPSFDYFPLNKAQDCIDFCKSEINYAIEWNNIEEFELGTRYPSIYAILLRWRVPESENTIELPICSCYDGDLEDEFLGSSGLCDNNTCPGNSNEFCGALAGDESFATVYCIEDGNGRCDSGSSSQATEPSVSTAVTEEMDCRSDSTTTEYSSTSKVTSTPFPSTSEVTTTTEQGVTTEFPDLDPPVESSSESVGTSISDTTTSYRTTITTDNTNDQTTFSVVTSPHTELTTVVTNPVSSENPQNIKCTNKCRKDDRHGNKWEGCAGRKIWKPCSRLIPGSSGYAHWHCNNQSQFSTSQPNVTGCKSRWVQEMKEKLENVNNMSQACEFTSSLHEGCKLSHEQKSDTKYFGQEISQLAYLINDTLNKAKLFPGQSQGEFEKLVNSAVNLDACLINQHEPWIDLTIFERSYLSSELLEATEDVLFHLTQVVNTHTKYSKVFQPIQQFTAAAEAFDKGSVSKEPYIFPPDRGQNRESCIKLPVGWTDLLPDNKVEIAVISIAPECVAKVMTGTGVYEVNGENDRMLNGRLMSLTVTSSPSTSEMSIFTRINAVRSYPLKFSGEGVEIAFHHAVDAWGDKIYDIPRKLHEGEKRKAVMGSALCAFWDTKLNFWSTEGCQLVKTSRLETVCECFHLTSFALLMDVHRYVGKDTGLNIITLILCPISEIGLLLAIIILTLAKNCAYKIRTTICKHLCFCLFLGNGMILIFLDRNYIHMSEGVCMGAAMVAHYIFLCAFMWMFFEGVQLYRMVVNVFDSGKSYMRHFEIIAYGSPFIIIAITAVIAYMNGDTPYGGDPYCWLVGNYIWTFMVPVALVITVNLIILFIALKTAYQLQHQGQTQKAPVFITEKIRSYRIYFRGCFSLTVILGITWVLGFFVLMEGSGKIIAAYLFTILNASQGLFIFIFTFRVHMSKVRLFTQRKLSAFFPSLLNTGSTNNSISIKKPNVVSRNGLGKDSIS